MDPVGMGICARQRRSLVAEDTVAIWSCAPRIAELLTRGKASWRESQGYFASGFELYFAINLVSATKKLDASRVCHF